MPPKILFLTSSGPNYQEDFLAHGLSKFCEVTDWGQKPSLRGYVGLDCFYFDLPLRSTAEDQVRAELAAGYYDLVVCGSCRSSLQLEQILALSPRPIALLEGEDTAGRFDHPNVGWFFQRELTARPTGKEYPLQFGVCLDKIPTLHLPKVRDYYFCGLPSCELRREVAAALGCALQHEPDRDTYLRNIHQSHLGISIPGAGFDTVRYWEIPAVQTLLLTKRPTIIIRDNFVDMESAVFWDSVADLQEKIQYLIGKPEEVARITEAGYQHVLAHHTTEANARYVLQTCGVLL